MTDAAALLSSLLMYCRHPMTSNSPDWCAFTVPSDVIDQIENVLADELLNHGPGVRYVHETVYIPTEAR